MMPSAELPGIHRVEDHPISVRPSQCIRDLCSLLWIVKYIPDAGCSYEQLKQHDADAFHRRVFRHCCRLWINRTIDRLFLRC
jgi:hypothetical protein